MVGKEDQDRRYGGGEDQDYGDRGIGMMNTWVVGCHNRMDHISSALIRQNLYSADSTLHILGSVTNACIS